MNEIKLEKLIDLLTTENFSFVGTYTDSEGETQDVVLVDTSFFKLRAKTVHGEKKFLYYGTNPKQTFLHLWSSYEDNEHFNFGMLYKAYTKDYDPLANYDKNSKITLTKSGKETDKRTAGITTTVSNTGSETRTFTNGKQTSTDFEVPFDEDGSSYEKEVGKTENASVTNSEKLEFSSRSTATSESGSEVNEHSFSERADTTLEHTSGNIGVTTSAQMLQGELGARMVNLANLIIDRFVNEYCYYSNIRDE